MAEKTPTTPLIPTTPFDKSFLKSAAPVKDFGGSATESLALRQSVADLNKAAQVIAGGATGDKDDFNAQLALATSDSLLITGNISAPPIEEPQGAPAVKLRPADAAPQPANPPPSRVLLTGRGGVGKRWLASQVPGATVLQVEDGILNLLRPAFPGVTDVSLTALVNGVRAWGDGVYSKDYPPSIQRLLFRQWALSNGVNTHDWGKPGFWLRQCLEAARNLTGTIVLIGVAMVDEYRLAVSEGFKHFHVCCSPQTWSTRKTSSPATGDALATALDGDVTKKISVERTGPRLSVVWNDPVISSPSPRLYSSADWLRTMRAIPAVSSPAIPQVNVDGIL
jgi:hypothetical protein